MMEEEVRTIPVDEKIRKCLDDYFDFLFTPEEKENIIKNSALSSIFQEALSSERRFIDFLTAVDQTEPKNMGEYMGFTCIDDDVSAKEFDGNIWISCWAGGYDDSQDFPIRLDDFIFYVKTFAIFYRNEFNPEFDVKPYFKNMDELLHKYSKYVYPDIEPEERKYTIDETRPYGTELIYQAAGKQAIFNNGEAETTVKVEGYDFRVFRDLDTGKVTDVRMIKS